ncbi:MAG: TIGR03905 family TSCPD domain-containing protein [Desulfobacterium sp.]|nr:TIGR03905 family TSCPD domain-containing protein [Desulfobacterium sp.]
MFTYVPSGVCSKRIEFEIKDGNIGRVVFEGGCPGNLEGISRLVEGMPVADVITRLQGITCGKKTTSCPDQLALALGEWEQNDSVITATIGSVV